MRRIKLFIYFILAAIFATTLTGCDRAIPSPGKVTMPTATDTFAENYLLGNTLILHVKHATRCMKEFNHQTIKIDFLLGQQYRLNQVKDRRVLPLLNSGNYHYSIDYHEPHEGMLNLISKGGWNVLMSYQTRNTGTFFARVARGKCRSRMKGTFRIVVTNPHYPN